MLVLNFQISLPLSASHSTTGVTSYCVQKMFQLLPTARTPLPSGVRATLLTLPCLSLLNTRSSLPLLRSQRRTEPPLPPETAFLPSLEKATVMAPLLGWAGMSRTSLPLCESHSFSLLSWPADRMCLPSGEYTAEMTMFLWPARLCNSLPFATSQILSVLSLLAVTACLPSGEKAQHWTILLWP